MKIKEVISGKYTPTINYIDNLTHIMRLLLKNRLSIVLVTDNERIIGKISVKDLAIYILRNIRRLRALEYLVARDIMKPLPKILSVEEDLLDAIEEVIEYRDAILVYDTKLDKYLAFNAEDAIKAFSFYVRDKDLHVNRICSKDILTAPATQSVIQVYKRIVEDDKDSAIVVDMLRRPIGIITYSNIVNHPIYRIKKKRFVIRDSDGRVLMTNEKYPSASDIMSSPLYIADIDETVSDAVEKMIRNRIGHLPIVNKGRIYGVLNKYDILALILREHK